MLSWLTSDQALRRSLQNVAAHLAPLLQSRLCLQLWDGTRLPLGPGKPGPFVVALSSPGVVSSLLRRPTLANLVEHYLDGRIDFQGGDLMAFGEAVRSGGIKGGMKRASKLYLLRQLWPFLFRAPDRSVVEHAVPDAVTGLQRPQRNRREYIQFHYDLSTDFYKLFLDKQLVYSCAYFTRSDGDLDRAQADKLDMICRKLRLEPTDRFLDVGCGWGALVCHAAQRYGVLAHGVTLSQEQYDYARTRVRRLGLDDRVTIELVDYADLDGQYDKIASIGMYEHVGIANYPAYFTKLHALLRDRGVLLNHGIVRHAKRTPAEFRKLRPEYRMIQKYIFPGGELDHIGHTLEVMEGCRFEVHDVEGWREHYARTLRLWCQRLSARRDEAVRLVGEQKYRAWVAYLAGFSFAFEDGFLRIFQTVATKHAKKGVSGMPLTRAHLYTAAGDLEPCDA
ncbi:MAG: cyclopropane-fatty-acyl-phospholipid synthase family protein [Gemmataceae bacterium]